MKPKTIILLVVALGCGLGASYMTSRLLADRSKPEQPTNTVKVLIAKKKVPAFESIKKPEDFFEEKEVPEGTYPAKCLKSFDDVRNQRLAKVKGEEETVFKDDILSVNAQGVYANLPEGQRAVAIAVNPVSLVGGLVLPGARVDIIGTFQGASNEVFAETIMQNMLVLAIDTKTDRGEQMAMLGSTVTFACTQEESMRLAVAAKATDIRLVLRSPTDHEKLTLPRSKFGDWQKPPTIARKDDDGSGDADGGPAGLPTGRAKQPAAPLAYEALNAMPAQDNDAVALAPVTPVTPVTPPQVKHVMLITSGVYETKEVFVKDENGEWSRPGRAEQSDESSARPKTPGR
jgi:Flp pilus assembly protein CpaB